MVGWQGAPDRSWKLSDNNESGANKVERHASAPDGADRPLRRGWTTGTCAAAAARGAFEALVTGCAPAVVSVTLPNGSQPSFALAVCEAAQDIPGGRNAWRAGVVKDAGDDPDVTHGALVVATVRKGEAGTGVRFEAGAGVGTVTKPGLQLAPGEPAINPVPRTMIETAIRDVAAQTGARPDVVVEISIPGGEEIAKKTLNGRLGIVGGLSVLGTTGIVIPFSCSAWIHSIHRGIDVARAMEIGHVVGATGTTSENAACAHYGLQEEALVEMGDFAGGMLKYLRGHPVRRVTVAGGFAKMTKLAQGLLDLHSKRGAVDFAWLAERVLEAGGGDDLVRNAGGANTAQQVLEAAQAQKVPIADHIARLAWQTAARALQPADIELDVLVFNRAGNLVGQSGVNNVHAILPR